MLVIEDTPEVSRAVKRNLRTLGLEILIAGGGAEGLDFARTHIPDLVLTDVNMPGMDGFEVLAELRRDPATAAVPVVLMTARDDRASVRRGMGMGADDYLTKPFTSQELRDTVQARLAHVSRMRAIIADRLRETEEALEHATHHDSETGLPNRVAFRTALKQLEQEQSPVAIMALELDRFDRLEGVVDPTRPRLTDTVVRDVSLRIQRVVEGDGSLYRLGPALFAVIYRAARDSREAEAVADCLLGDIRQPIGSEDLELRMTASVGVAMWDGSESPETTASHAESAAHKAREAGGNHVRLYDEKASATAYNRLVLESSMHRALERNQFELHYQPQVSAKTGELLGVEALIRWKHPELGMISPFHFIPIAEETGLILEIGRWVLEAASVQIVQWSQTLPGLRVAVNLSALQLQDNLVQTVQGIIERTGIPPRQLKVELTESMMVQAGKQAAAALHTVRDLGVGISIDDFGTGYSSLQNLRSFPIGEVKIDRSFVRHVPDDRDNSSIVSAVIEMAHQLGLRVVAEGVEEDSQLDFLRERGCDDIQGYYYSKPLAPEEFLSWALSFRQAA